MLQFSAGLVSVGHAVRRYFQVLGALLRREEEARRRAPLESMMDLLEPLVLIGIMSLAWWFLSKRNSAPLGGSPVLFYATGFFAKYFFIYLSRGMRRSIDAPTRRFPVETRLDHIIVHIIVSTIDYAILGVLVFAIIYLFFSPAALPYDFLTVLQALTAIVMLSFGWGIINLVLARLWWPWEYIFPAFNRMLVLFSGVFYLVDFLPPTARYVLSFNPMLHGIVLFRLGFYPNQPTMVLDTSYLAWCCVCSIAIGLVLERTTRHLEGRRRR